MIEFDRQQKEEGDMILAELHKITDGFKKEKDRCVSFAMELTLEENRVTSEVLRRLRK